VVFALRANISSISEEGARGIGYCRVTDDEGGARDTQEEAEQQQFQSCLSQLDGFSNKRRSRRAESAPVQWKMKPSLGESTHGGG
jgi:hypothetical protein